MVDKYTCYLVIIIIYRLCGGLNNYLEITVSNRRNYLEMQFQVGENWR